MCKVCAIYVQELCKTCWTFSQGLPNVAKVALPLVRQGELNPEDEDLFCTSLFRNQSAHNEYQSYYMQTSELIKSYQEVSLLSGP